MKKKHLHMIVISLTPFDEKGELDEPAMRKHLQRLKSAGVSVFLCGSGTGEGYALTSEDQERIFALGIEELKGHVPVFADGCEPRLPSEMVDFVRRAERGKVDAVRVMPLDIGHNARPTNDELLKYNSTAIEATSLPVILTTHQAAGYLVPLDVIGTLLDRFPQIQGINCGTNDLYYLSQLIGRFSDRVEVHCAGPLNGPTTLVLGGNGFMGPDGNVAPQLTQSVIDSFAAGNMETLRESYAKLMALSHLNEKYGHGRGLKAMLRGLGLPAGYPRPPRIPIEAEDVAQYVKEVRALKLPGISEANGK